MRSPPGHWLLGHLPALRNDPLNLLDQCSAGVIPLNLGTRAWFVLAPADAAHVLEHSESTYTKGRAFRFGKRLYGNSLLVSEGSEHRQQAQHIGALFFQHAAQLFEQSTIQQTRRWLNRWQDGQELDLQSSLVELTLAISSQSMFGEDFVPAWRSQNAADHSEHILHAFDTAMQHVARQAFTWFPPPDWLPTPANRRYRKAIRVLDAALHSAVERRIAGTHSGGFLDHLLNAHLEQPATFSRKQLRDQALVLLLGAYESTATTLCWTMLLLSQHDAIRNRMRTEIREVVSAEDIQASDAKSLRYVAQVFSESLRLYPSAWLIPRAAAQRDTLPSGLCIPQGCQVFLSPYRTQRDAGVFEDPLTFDPDRFDLSAPAHIPHGGYFPFGMGPRQCLGESVARSQAVLILATLFRHRDFQPLNPELPRPEPLLTLRPPSPLPVRIRYVS